MEDKPKINDKVIFTVSFLALLLPLSSYKDELNGVKISFFCDDYSLYQILLIMAVLLFISTYISAIENLKSSTLGIDWRILNYCNPVADLFYAIAILVFPIWVLILSFFSFVSDRILLLFKIPDLYANHIDYIVSLTSILIGFLITIFINDLINHRRSNNE